MSSSAEHVELPSVAAVHAAAKRIADRVLETPCLRAWELGERVGQALWLKAESLQVTGSFKARGALNWVRTASAAEVERGLITVSAGNHALALAWAAAQRGARLTVLMPEGSSPLKIESARRLGAEVIVHGTIQQAVARTHELCREQGLTLVHPYDDPRVMAGQGTVALELLEQCPEVTRVLCPIGGGGLISGLGIVLKDARPSLELIGVEPAGAATMRNAWNHDDPAAALERIDTMAVSLAPAVVGRYTFAAARRYVDDVVTVGEDAIAEATRELLLRGRLYVETGAAVGLAALLEGVVATAPDRPTALILTGGNMDSSQLLSILEPQAPRT